jgi:hypothetical protein
LTRSVVNSYVSRRMPGTQPTSGLRARHSHGNLLNHYHYHDGAVTVRPCLLVRRGLISQMICPPWLSVWHSILLEAPSLLCNRDTSLLDCSSFVERAMAADRPQHAAHTVGTSALHVSHTNSGVRRVPVLVSASLLVPIQKHDHYLTLRCPPGPCLFTGRPPLVYSSICTCRVSIAMHGIV